MYSNSTQISHSQPHKFHMIMEQGKTMLLETEQQVLQILPIQLVYYYSSKAIYKFAKNATLYLRAMLEICITICNSKHRCNIVNHSHLAHLQTKSKKFCYLDVVAFKLSDSEGTILNSESASRLEIP